MRKISLLLMLCSFAMCSKGVADGGYCGAAEWQYDVLATNVHAFSLQARQWLFARDASDGRDCDSAKLSWYVDFIGSYPDVTYSNHSGHCTSARDVIMVKRGFVKDLSVSPAICTNQIAWLATADFIGRLWKFWNPNYERESMRAFQAFAAKTQHVNYVTWSRAMRETNDLQRVVGLALADSKRILLRDFLSEKHLRELTEQDRLAIVSNVAVRARLTRSEVLSVPGLQLLQIGEEEKPVSGKLPPNDNPHFESIDGVWTCGDSPQKSLKIEKAGLDFETLRT